MGGIIVIEENIEEPVGTEHKKSFFEKLQKASSDLNSIKTSFSKSMDELAKVQDMLGLEGADNISTMIQDFEDRLSESERKRDEASEGARRYGEELEKEKERLIKLWDAYKNQEEELSTQEKRATELEEKLSGIEQSRGQFEEDSNARIVTLTQKLEEKEKEVQQLEEFRQRIVEFDNIRNQLEETANGLKGEINARDEQIKSLENQVEELKQFEQFAEFKAKFEEVSEEFEKEKERLTKLFRLYEETETENKKLKDDLKGWQDWFDSNEGIFTKLFSSAGHLRRKVSTPAVEENEAVSFPEETEKNETKKKSRGRLRFKK